MTVDANRGAAMECMDRARAALSEKDAEKARRMLEKAKKLDPTQDITFLLKKVESMMGTRSESRNSEERSYSHDDHYDDTNIRSRKKNKSPNRTQGSSGGGAERTNGSIPSSAPTARPRSTSRTPKLGVDFTAEQQKLVERIRHCKDYYEILQVTKEATDADIKKEYRKMALQLHPDKCRAPHATEAFKALGNAYAILSNAEKRKQYDLYGAEEAQSVSRPGHSHRRHGDFFQYEYGHGFESDFSPEEIFNMFFGGGFPGEAVNRRRRPQNHSHDTHNQNDNPYGPLMQLLPLIAILVLGLVAQLMVGDPPFSLQQSNKFPIKRSTMDLKVTYFVRSDFESTQRGRIKVIENQVEDEYLNQLRMNCYKETNQRDTLIYRARWQRDTELMQRAERMPMPHCDRLKEIYGR